MSQLELFDGRQPEDRRCGTCVCRNATNENQDFGDCAYLGARHNRAPACANWFGLTELRRPLYGAGKAR